MFLRQAPSRGCSERAWIAQELAPDTLRLIGGVVLMMVTIDSKTSQVSCVCGSADKRASSAQPAQIIATSDAHRRPMRS